MRREAVLSSRIEGTQASLSDLLAYEASHRARGDVREVVNYITAIEQGIGMLDQLPICIRLADQLHSTLMAGVRGHERHPGELRDEQVWIGSEGTPIQDARFIPPPANRVLETLGDWERFANEPVEFPPLVQCALLHYQFEAIHPYLDGNGRIGRLLIILFLCAQGVLPTPLLYLSAYFERDRQEYYRRIYQVGVGRLSKGRVTVGFEPLSGRLLERAVLQQQRRVHRRDELADLRRRQADAGAQRKGRRQRVDLAGPVHQRDERRQMLGNHDGLIGHLQGVSEVKEGLSLVVDPDRLDRPDSGL